MAIWLHADAPGTTIERALGSTQNGSRMFRKASHVSPLELRTQLLVAESELNRALLSEDWHAMTHGVANLAHRAKTIAAWASSAGVLVAGVSAWRRGPSKPGTERPSWAQKILNGAPRLDDLARIACPRLKSAAQAGGLITLSSVRELFANRA